MYLFGEVAAVVADSTQKVRIAQATSPRYVTPEGLHIRDSELAARAAYPNAKIRTDEHGGSDLCDARGMLLNTFGGRVVNIQVWSPGC